MHIWIDTAEAEIIDTANEMGLIYGVTTNPTILSRSPASPKTTIDRILAQQKGPVAVQVTQSAQKEMLYQAKKLANYNNRIIVKIPATQDGFKVMASMAKENLPFLATTILDVKQVYLASIIGAKYVSPYFTAIHLLHGCYQTQAKKMQTILDRQNSKTQILAANITEVEQVIFFAELGIPSITIPAKVFLPLIESPPTIGDHLKKFADAWNNREDELFNIEKPNI